MTRAHAATLGQKGKKCLPGQSSEGLDPTPAASWTYCSNSAEEETFLFRPLFWNLSRQSKLILTDSEGTSPSAGEAVGVWLPWRPPPTRADSKVQTHSKRKAGAGVGKPRCKR